MPDNTAMHQRLEKLFRDFYNHGMPEHKPVKLQKNTVVNSTKNTHKHGQNRARGRSA